MAILKASCLSFSTSLKSKVHFIHFTDEQKGTNIVTWVIYRPDEKSYKKYWKVEIELSKNDNTKIPQNASVSEHVRKKMWN